MADINNLNNEVSQIVTLLQNLSNGINATIFDIADARSKVRELLSSGLSEAEIRRIKEQVLDAADSVNDAGDSAEEAGEKFKRASKSVDNQISELESEIEVIKKLRESANSADDAYLAKQQQAKQEELNILQKYNGSSNYELNKRIELAQRHREALEQQNKEEIKRRNENVDKIVDNSTKLLQSFTKIFTQSITSIVNTYEQNAGKLSSALDASVTDIGNLQNKIASELRSDSLRSAISNIAVLTEAASLASAGYTNTEKLQESATDVAIGRRIASNLNFDNSTVKNLTNIFGSDFIDRFSAIQAAVQDAAGTTININSNISKMMSDLSPVYQNAEYQITALQGSSDVQATLAKARDMGLITEGQESEYLQMINELMDPSKAFKSSSTAVKVAATNYDFGSGDPMQALQALLGAREQMYGSISSSNDYMGNISRSLAASAYGDNTLNATYMQSGLYGLDSIYTEDLSAVYQKQLNKLQSGDYTTTKEAEQNWVSNSPITQNVANLSKWLPTTYATFSATLFGLINSLPKRIGNAINRRHTASGTIADIVDTEGDVGTPGDVVNGNSTGGDVGGQPVVANNTVAAAGGHGFRNWINNSAFFNESLLGIDSSTSTNAFSRYASRATSGFGMMNISNAVAGGLNLGNQLINGEGSFANRIGYGGDTTAAMGTHMQTLSGIGGTIGMIWGPIGGLIGTAAGALVGAITGSISASVARKEAEEENTKAILAQTQATRDLIGLDEGVSALDALESKRTLAEGGGIVHLKSGDYKIASTPGAATGMDYVPYDDYLVRLHKGESVVTADAANRLRRQDPNFWNSPLKTNEDYNIVGTLEKQTESIVGAIRNDQQFSPLTRQGGQKQFVISNNFA